jgi:hypothetical protein
MVLSTRVSPYWCRAAVPLALLGLACAGRLRDDRISNFISKNYKYMIRNYEWNNLAYHAIKARCPLVGMPARAIEVSFGEPHARDSLPTGVQRVTYELGKDAPMVMIDIVADTVQSWEVSDYRTWSKVPAPPGYQGRVASPTRVRTYVLAHPETNSRLVYAMYRACPQPGMSQAMLVASWGEPRAVDTLDARGRARLRLTYGYGIEGEGEEYDFEADSLVTNRPCGWPLHYHCRTGWDTSAVPKPSQTPRP